MKKPSLPSIPEFSDSSYKIVGYVVGALVTCSGVFFLYEVFADGDLTFIANWNMFDSPLGSVCLVIGFFWAMLWWGRFTHWTSTPVNEYRDRYGNLVAREESMDIMDQGFAKIIMPLLGHFIIEPIIYAAFIYYPIQCIIALVGSIFPYILALIVLAIILMSWLFTSMFTFRYRSVALVVLGLLFIVSFAWGGIAIRNAGTGATIQMAADVSQGGSEVVTESATVDELVEEDIDDQFAGYGEEGLFGSLPDGTTAFAGDMGGSPIEFNITKNTETGETIGMYKNVNSGTIMRMTGESLPAMAGDICFYGKDGNDEWNFDLSGDADNISGTANSGDKHLKVTLYRK